MHESHIHSFLTHFPFICYNNANYGLVPISHANGFITLPPLVLTSFKAIYARFLKIRNMALYQERTISIVSGGTLWVRLDMEISKSAVLLTDEHQSDQKKRYKLFSYTFSLCNRSRKNDSVNGMPEKCSIKEDFNQNGRLIFLYNITGVTTYVTTLIS